jgi:hypothetical protein
MRIVPKYRFLEDLHSVTSQKTVFVLRESTILSCGLVAKLPGCRPRGPRFNSRRYHIFLVTVGLKRGPLSLVRINEKRLRSRKLILTTVGDPPR